MSAHTPTPWRVSGTSYIMPSQGKEVIADCFGDKNDAAHIVLCVNAHDALVTSVKDLLDVCPAAVTPDEYAMVTAARAALKLAGEP